jgi:hypothetical protein
VLAGPPAGLGHGVLSARRYDYYESTALPFSSSTDRLSGALSGANDETTILFHIIEPLARPDTQRCHNICDFSKANQLK